MTGTWILAASTRMTGMAEGNSSNSDGVDDRRSGLPTKAMLNPNAEARQPTLVPVLLVQVPILTLRLVMTRVPMLVLMLMLMLAQALMLTPL